MIIAPRDAKEFAKKYGTDGFSLMVRRLIEDTVPKGHVEMIQWAHLVATIEGGLDELESALKYEVS